MNSYIKFGILCCIFGVGVESTVIPTGQVIKKDNWPQALTYIGSIEGKNFFAETTTGHNWQAADALCKASDMKLASITSQAQLQVLKTFNGSAAVKKGYWTAGRETHMLHAFTWDGTLTQPVALPFEQQFEQAYLTCLAYDAEENNHFFYARECATEIGTICEN